MMELQEAGMLRGQQSATQQLALISSHEDLQQALQGAFFVQVFDLPRVSGQPSFTIH